MKNDSVLFPAKGGFSFELYDIKKNDNALLFCCAWIQWFGCSESEVSLVVGLTVACSRPGPRVLAPAIILPLFGSGYLCWAVCFHVFHSSAVSWPDTQLSIWALRPCTLDAYAYIRCVPSFANASMYANACVCVCLCACNCASLRLSTCTLTPSLINVRGLRQALHAAFCCDRHIFGLPVARGVRVGTMHDASTKTVAHKTDLCHPHFVLGPLKEVQHLVQWMRRGPPLCFGVER